MKRRICKVLFVIGLIMVFGIIGGIDCGEPLTNVLWCAPIMFLMWLVAGIGGIFDEE